jgi:Mor family transcriptional regulator
MREAYQQFLNPTPDVLLHFWRRVRMSLYSERCWLWRGGKVAHGYGNAIKNGTALSHRVAWILSNKTEIPYGLCVCHTCDAPACCNPTHLKLMTQTQNLQDASQKGRMHHKLNRDQVYEISKSYSQQKTNTTELAKHYGVSASTIFNIINKQHHKSVERAECSDKTWSFRGSHNPNSKFNETDIPIIRTRFLNGETQAALAKEYAVSQVTIHLIVRRKQWKHVR